ncbi:MAG: response regulator [Pedosphaera sp.]|nr:response regulator [Pedosphaera sp.]
MFARQVTSQFLSAHEVTIVPSLAEARQIVLAGQCDLVLVDYDLDDGKGAELVKEIHTMFPALPMIGVSSHEEGNQIMLKAGARAICSKMQFDRIEAVIGKVRNQA